MVEKAKGFCFHIVWETMPTWKKDSLESIRYAFLLLLVLRFLDDGTHSIDGEEGIRFSRCEQKGMRSQRSYQRVQITDLYSGVLNIEPS